MKMFLCGFFSFPLFLIGAYLSCVVIQILKNSMPNMISCFGKVRRNYGTAYAVLHVHQILWHILKDFSEAWWFGYDLAYHWKSDENEPNRSSEQREGEEK